MVGSHQSVTNVWLKGEKYSLGDHAIWLAIVVTCSVNEDSLVGDVARFDIEVVSVDLANGGVVEVD